MTGDDRLHDELEALERAAPADLPPRPSTARPPRWLRLTAPAVVVLATALVVAVALPGWLDGLRPPGSVTPSPGSLAPSAMTGEPTRSPASNAAASVTLFSHWADCCYVEGALTYATLSGGPTSHVDQELTANETWLIRAGSYQLTLYHSPCNANCGNPGGVVGPCTLPLEVSPGDSLLVRIEWHIGAACEASAEPRRPALSDPGLIAGSLTVGDGCVVVTDPDAYRWTVALPAGYYLASRNGPSPSAIVGPDGTVIAEYADYVLFLGTTTGAGPSGCADGIAYQATEVGVIKSRILFAQPGATLPPVRPIRQIACHTDVQPERSTLHCAPAIAAALGGFADGENTIARVEVYYGGYCPPGVRCAAPPPNIGYVVLRIDGDVRMDLWAEVADDSDGVVTATSLSPFPPRLTSDE